MNIEVLRGELASLKLAAKPKRWDEPPAAFVEIAGYLFTCCIENALLTLAVSYGYGGRTIDGDALEAVIHSVFGAPLDTVKATYPRRGPTKLYRWRYAPPT